jgi:hypothetical protein
MTKSPEERKGHNDNLTERAIEALRNAFMREREELERQAEQEEEDKDTAHKPSDQLRLNRYADYEQMDEYPMISNPFMFSYDAQPVDPE